MSFSFFTTVACQIWLQKQPLPHAPINIQLHASCSCMFCLNLWMKVWQHRWWWYEPRFRIKTARLSGGPEGLKSEFEHVSESTYAWNRGLGSSVGVYISSHQLFFLICQLLFCLLTVSLAAACGMEKGTCQNYTWGFSSSTNHLTTDGHCWIMWPVCIESLILKI